MTRAQQQAPPAQQIDDSILDAVGRTPLVRLSRLAAGLTPQVVAKVEYLNPGGSIKDRVAVAMIEAAERDGRLKPGGTIVEPTSGNTGTGLAIAARLKGYRVIAVMPDKQSKEKMDLLRAYGAEVVVAPTDVPPESPESYYKVAERLASEIPGGFRPNQYSNDANPDAHYATTGPELWEQTAGAITHLVVGVGTGGTITGTGRYLKERNPAIEIIGADPAGSIYTAGPEGPKQYLVEGVGEDFWPDTFDPAIVDRYVKVSDRDAFLMTRRLAMKEGILTGGSCGLACVAALEVARGIDDPAALMVVILPDGGRSYLSKLYDDEWMRKSGLMDTPGSVVRVVELLRDRHHDGELPDLVVARTTQSVGEAIGLLQEYGISQMPVSQDAEGTALESIVGSVSEKGLLDRAFRDPSVVERTIGEVMDRPLPLVDDRSSLDEAFGLLSADANALVATRGDRPVGVITKLDLLEFLSHLPDGRG